MKRGTRVCRKDNGQIGVLYKEPKGGILYVLVVGGKRLPNTKEPAKLGCTTTWHESQVRKCVRLFKSSDVINANLGG